MTTAVLTRAEREAKLEGMGCKRKRVEDIRFTQGKGNYVDDLKLPGMLFGDFVRSQYAHARVKKIDTSKALKDRSAIVRFMEQLRNMDSGEDIYHRYSYPHPPLMAWMLRQLARLPDLAGLLLPAVVIAKL